MTKAHDENLNLHAEASIYATAAILEVEPEAPPVAPAAASAEQRVFAESSAPSTGLFQLSEEQTRLLEQAIAQAASAVQAQAEAEAALEQEAEDGEDDGEEGRV